VSTTAITQLTVAIANLRPYPGNPRRGDVEAIKASLRAHGQYRPIVVNRPTMQVLAGNHTLEAAKQLGWEEIAATFLDVDNDQARRIVLVDNRTNDFAAYDTQALVDFLEELPELDGSGYDQADLDALLDQVAWPADDLDEEIPPAPKRPTTKAGDVWALGRHRLICADATHPAAYRAVMGEAKAQLLWTDPPYGVAYTGKTARALTIQNDGAEGLDQLLAGSFAAIDQRLVAGARLYVAHPAGGLSAKFIAAFLDQGWRLAQTLVWLKDSMVLGHADYHYRHEPILYGYKPGPGRQGRGGRGWYGDDAQTSVFEVPRPKAAREHPTMKPPALVEAALANSSRRDQVVLDPFAGSGSTLVACERTGRHPRLIELDPGYCDVIVRRFERLTGQTGERVDG
jgi:site-specific DNA-methyltransferase (adenine-specific)